MNLRVSGVYVIEGRCGPSYVAYVGSSHNIHNRWLNHKHAFRAHKNNYILQTAWDLWGESCFTIRVLEECEGVGVLREREDYWIEKLRPNCNLIPATAVPESHRGLGIRKPIRDEWPEKDFDPLYEPHDDFMRPKLSERDAAVTKVAREAAYVLWKQIDDQSVTYEDFLEYLRFGGQF